MSATSAARAYTREITGQTARMSQTSDSALTITGLERAYAPLRPTVYRPSGPSATRSEEHDGNGDAGWLSLCVLCVVLLALLP